MDSIRLRLFGLVEWIAAAACVLAVLIAVGGVTRQIHIVRPVVRVNAEGATSLAVPSNVPSGAIMVRELVLPDGKRLAVGNRLTVLEPLGARAQTDQTVTERDGDRLRESRPFQYAGMAFVVVTEHDEIIAIYR